MATVASEVPDKDIENADVKAAVAAIADDQTIQDTNKLIQMMQDISTTEPRLWNVATIGFDSYHYKYESGRQGDNFVIGFYPRKGKITIYVMDGTAGYAKQLAVLGKHTISGYCIYIKKLSDIDLTVLEQILKHSYSTIKSLAKDGPITKILWQTNK